MDEVRLEFQVNVVLIALVDRLNNPVSDNKE
jgi:hypothetical protein